MGQAKQRGTYEDRMMAARDKIDDLNGKREEHLRILTKIEEDTTREAMDSAKIFIEGYIEQREKERAGSIRMRIGGNNGKESTGQ